MMYWPKNNLSQQSIELISILQQVQQAINAARENV